MKIKRSKLIIIFSAFIYISTILYVTIISREHSLCAEFVIIPFWSYYNAILGDKNLFFEILKNIVLFFPLGVILYLLTKKIKLSLFCVVSLSVFVEILQLMTHRGLFEFDDIISNSIGGMMGITTIRFINNRIRETVISILTGIVICLCAVSCLFITPQKRVLENDFEFQVSFKDDKLCGECFVWGSKSSIPYTIILYDLNTKNKIYPKITTGLKRDSVNEYFNSDCDYSNCGFEANISSSNNSDYEILVKFKGSKELRTNTFLIHGRIMYIDDFGLPTNNYINEVFNNGICLVMENSCLVYQYDRKLYWFLDKDFPLESDGRTIILYELFTVDSFNSDSYSIRTGINKKWINYSFVFEDNEIQSFGNYRIAVQDLPTDFPIVSILTGYYKNGKKEWQKYFRPIISELI